MWPFLAIPTKRLTDRPSNFVQEGLVLVLHMKHDSAKTRSRIVAHVAIFGYILLIVYSEIERLYRFLRTIEIQHMYICIYTYTIIGFGVHFKAIHAFRPWASQQGTQPHWLVRKTGAALGTYSLCALSLTFARTKTKTRRVCCWKSKLEVHTLSEGPLCVWVL